MRNRGEKQEAQRNRQFQSQQAGKQMRFQERMRNTSWQAGIADMEAAGVNPALAYSQGGASAPMGASGSGAQAQIDDVVTSGVSSAMQAKRMGADLKLLKAQERSVDEDAYLKQQQRYTAHALEGKYDIEMERMKLDLPGAQNVAKFERGAAGQGSALVRALVRAARGR